jgi:tRNA threonylcarbamoyl adenosine modification protein (Sua5/YciO/YrdC/YwlC family)
MSQFFYIHPDNPQARLLNQAVAIIRNGGVVRIRQLKKDHNFSLVCRDLSELSLYARVENQLFRALKACTPGPYTFIFRGTKEVPKRLLNLKRKTIGIRVPDNAIAQGLLEVLGEPLMSTTLTLPGNDFAEADPEEIRDQLEGQVDLIIHGGYLGQTPTTVVDMSQGQMEVVRVGSGDVSPFEH